MGIKETFNRKFKEERFHNLITMIFNFIWALLKIVFGLIKLSGFLCVSAIYTFCLGISKHMFFKGRKSVKNNEDSVNQYYLFIGIVIIVASICYLIYMVRLFFIPSNTTYGMIPAIAIAAMAFTELYFAIYGLIKAGKKKDLLTEGLKAINLVSALSAIALTQTAILSFTMEGDMSKYNGIMGTIVGVISICLGIYIVIKSIIINKRNNNETLCWQSLIKINII